MKRVFWLFFLPCLLCSCVLDDPNDDAGSESTDIVRVGDRLPLFSVETVDGQQRGVFSSDQLSGPTVIVFFNTGCSDCQRELPVLNAYYLRHQTDPGFQMVAIAREETEESVAAYWQAHGLVIPYSPQTDRRIYNLFATLTIPRVYFSTDEGIITWIGVEKFTLPES